MKHSSFDVAAYLAPVAIAFLMLVFLRGVDHYAPPDCGGPEPRENHLAALEILDHGTTTMTFHTTGYAYLTALVYLFLPNQPLSVLLVQIALLPLVVWCTGRLVAAATNEQFAIVGRLVAGLYYPFAYYSLAYSSIVPAFIFVTLALALAMPLLQGGRSWRRSTAVGLALGVAVCARPNYGLVGVFIALGLWVATRSLWEAIIRATPIAVISIGLLVGMRAANPPEPGQLLRGSWGLSRGLLQGSYQYSHRWWDWEWIEDPSDVGAQEYYAHLHRLEAEAGETYPHAEVLRLMRRDARARILGLPLNTMKKVVISSVRLWIFIPTHLESRFVKYTIGMQEVLILLAAIVGLAHIRKRPGLRWVLVGVVLTPILTHLLITVEARYSLPSRGVEMALASVGFLVVARRWLPALVPPSSATEPGAEIRGDSPRALRRQSV